MSSQIIDITHAAVTAALYGLVFNRLPEYPDMIAALEYYESRETSGL